MHFNKRTETLTDDAGDGTHVIVVINVARSILICNWLGASITAN